MKTAARAAKQRQSYKSSDVRRAVEWSPEEDRVLIDLQARLGNQWSQISKRIPGRSEAAVKSHWNGVLRKKVDMAAAVASSELRDGPSLWASAAPRSSRPLQRTPSLPSPASSQSPAPKESGHLSWHSSQQPSIQRATPEPSCGFGASSRRSARKSRAHRAPLSSSPRPLQTMAGTPMSPQSKPLAMRLSSKRAMMAVATAQCMRATQSPSTSQPFNTLKRAPSAALQAPAPKRAAATPGSPFERTHTPQPADAPLAAGGAAASRALMALQSDSTPAAKVTLPRDPTEQAQWRQVSPPARGACRLGTAPGDMDEATRRALCELGYGSPGGPLLRPGSRAGAGAATPLGSRLAAPSGRSTPVLPHMHTPGPLHALRHSFASPPLVFTSRRQHPATQAAGTQLFSMMMTPTPGEGAAAGRPSHRSAWTPRLEHRRDDEASAVQRLPRGQPSALDAQQQGAVRSVLDGSDVAADTHMELPGMTADQRRDRQHLIGIMKPLFQSPDRPSRGVAEALARELAAILPNSTQKPSLTTPAAMRRGFVEAATPPMNTPVTEEMLLSLLETAEKEELVVRPSRRAAARAAPPAPPPCQSALEAARAARRQSAVYSANTQTSAAAAALGPFTTNAAEAAAAIEADSAAGRAARLSDVGLGRPSLGGRGTASSGMGCLAGLLAWPSRRAVGHDPERTLEPRAPSGSRPSTGRASSAAPLARERLGSNGAAQWRMPAPSSPAWAAAARDAAAAGDLSFSPSVLRQQARRPRTDGGAAAAGPGSDTPPGAAAPSDGDPELTPGAGSQGSDSDDSFASAELVQQMRSAAAAHDPLFQAAQALLLHQPESATASPEARYASTPAGGSQSPKPTAQRFGSETLGGFGSSLSAQALPPLHKGVPLPLMENPSPSSSKENDEDTRAVRRLSKDAGPAAERGVLAATAVNSDGVGTPTSPARLRGHVATKAAAAELFSPSRFLTQ